MYKFKLVLSLFFSSFSMDIFQTSGASVPKVLNRHIATYAWPTIKCKQCKQWKIRDAEEDYCWTCVSTADGWWMYIVSGTELEHPIVDDGAEIAHFLLTEYNFDVPAACHRTLFEAGTTFEERVKTKLVLLMDWYLRIDVKPPKRIMTKEELAIVTKKVYNRFP